MIAWYFLTFCRGVIGLTFALSFGSKVLNVSGFQQTLRTFRLLPHQLEGSAIICMLSSECAVVVGMAIGGLFLLPAFALALLLLLLFSGAILSVLVRHVRTSCHCFGTSEQPITVIALWRNTGFLLCALGGCRAFAWAHQVQANPTIAVWVLAALGAGVFVVIWTQIENLSQLFARQ